MAASVVLYCSKEYHNYRQHIIIQFWKYFVDIRSEVWLNLFWEYICGKLFAIHLFSNPEPRKGKGTASINIVLKDI
jgi:hypothetical protein